MADEQRRVWLENAMDRWETSLLRTCFAILGDRALAEDAVQETFLKAWRAYGRYQGRAEEKTWVWRIAINTCKDMKKSAWSRHVDISTPLDSLPEGSVPFSEADDTVTRAVMALNDRLKAPVLLCDMEGMPVSEAAKALRVPRTTVYHRLKQAHTELKEALEEWYRE